MIKIAADLQGADKAQTELLSGALRAAEENRELFLYLCGNGAELREALKGREYCSDRIEIIDAPEIITNNDDPTLAFQEKKNSSLIKGMELCKADPEIGGFVSCGSTGAILVSAVMLLGRIGRLHPMLLCELRRRDDSPFCIVDCGANVDCRAEKLVDFARMGAAYMKAVGVSSPRIGLLSNGAESRKGNEIVKKAGELLRVSGMDFIGGVEGCSVLDGDADVIACEGFAGNILLKTIEGTAKAVAEEWRQLAEQLPEAERAGSLALADRLYSKYDYNAKGGAVLLGINLPVVKGHGAADAETLYHIIDIAFRLAKNKLTDRIKEEFSL